MTEENKFNGFPKEALRFLEQLKKNNSREWFLKHKEEYENVILNPSRLFVTEMGIRLQKISPHIIYEARVNRSLFRLNRDTRFSKDKTPYKTNIGIFFWEGSGKRMECPGFYFHLEPSSMMLGAGLYQFPKELLPVYRDAVVDPVLGKELPKAIKKIGEADFGKAVCGMPVDSYKKVPRGYDPEHPNAELLKFKGLHAGVESSIPKEFHTSAFLDYCFDRFKKLAPIHHWLVKMLS
ncbi:MAG: DUF2461 domain-containing protein [bacterium]|nr:DUF2461 domain-containing protein [bacterium]